MVDHLLDLSVLGIPNYDEASTTNSVSILDEAYGCAGLANEGTDSTWC